MASNSTKPKPSKSPAAELPTMVDDDGEDPFRFCNEYMYGIKTSEIWDTSLLDRAKSTYFILPEAPTDYEVIADYASLGMIKPTVRDFEKFWLDGLSDLHKDRYLLVNYMVAYDYEIRSIQENGGPATVGLKELWIEKTTQISRLIRGYVMEKNKDKFRRDGALSLFQNARSIDDILGVLRQQLLTMKRSIAARIDTMRMHPIKESLKDRLNQWIGILLCRVFSGFVDTYFVWVSYDAQNLRRYAKEVERQGEWIVEYLDGDSRLHERIEFMRKLNLAAPRWSRVDRRMILDAIESNGKSCRGTYVQVLLNEVGVEKFKKVVFGKQHFCGHCRRSSYTSDDRMWACKRCDTEGIRPRAWYCDRECQKSDWRQHKASKHPVLETKKAGKKKRKSRKK